MPERSKPAVPAKRIARRAETTQGRRSTTRASKLVVVANRLPLSRVGTGSASRWQSSAGGLVTALAPLLKSMPGVWIGWPGGEAKIRPFKHDGMRIRPVALSRDEVEKFYNGMANRTLWPLFHDAIRTPEFHQDWWAQYFKVNTRFARAAAAEAGKGDIVWVHDYHLLLVPAMLRALRPDIRIGFFLHIPFPPEELFEWLPWRREILEGLLGADVVGFQTQGGAQNFARLCREYTVAGGSGLELKYGKRRVISQSFPISIDYEWFNSRADSEDTRHRVADLRSRIGDRKLLLAIDRLDYTKGILHRLRAFEELLASGVSSVNHCVLVQIATPSRDAVADYAALRDEVERTVGRINGRFSQPGRVAVHYFRRNLAREELVAYYAAADVMLVTPLRDGMNLVAKEYVACCVDGRGVLVLSEFAGVARELGRALIVNPRDQVQFVEALRDALRMPREDARARMALLRNRVKRHHVYAWSDEFMATLKG